MSAVSETGGEQPAPQQQAANPQARPVRQLFAFVLAVLLVSQLAVSLLAWSLAEQQFVPELQRKAQTVGESLSNKLTRALGYGIPVEQLVGVDEFFAEVLRENADLAFLSLHDERGQVLFRSSKPVPAGREGDPSGADTPAVAVDVSFEGRRVGQLRVGVDGQYVASRIAGLRFDIAIVLFTSLLLAFEILWLVVTLNLVAPMRRAAELMTRMGNEAVRNVAAALPGQRLAEADLSRPAGEQRLLAVRILTILFMSAEMLTRTFMPIYAGSLSDYGLNLSDGLRSSLPITAFLLVIAIAMPYAGRWSDQIGRRRAYLMGTVFIATGLVISGLIPDYLMLMVARAVTGLGYAMMFMACQGLVIDNTSLRERGKGFAMVVSAIAVAQICAPPIGGILADRIGFQMVFIVGAGVALVAAAVASRLLDNQRTAAQDTAPAARMRLSVLFGNPRFWTLALLSGVPAQLIYTGFLSYLVPTLLTGMGNTQSEIGRDAMVYGLVVVALVPFFAWCCKRFETYALAVGLGGVLTGLGLLWLHWDPSPRGVVVGIAALGLGQSMSISAQLVLVTRATQAEALQMGSGPVLGAFRLIERLGAAAGPVAAGLLVASLGAPQATVWLGLFGLVASVLFMLGFFLTGRLSPKGSAP